MRIKEREGNENKGNENKIDVKRNATNDGDDETIKNNHYFKSLCQN